MICSGCEEKASQQIDPGTPGKDVFLIALEPLPGGSLKERLQKCKLLAPDAVLLAAADLMAGLAALHKLGYAHADLK